LSPLPAPTFLPTDAAATIVTLSLYFSSSSGLTCADYGASEEAALEAALAAVIIGIKRFTAQTCADDSIERRRRRRLLSDNAIVITTDVTVRDAAYDGLSKAEIAASVTSAVGEAAASGALHTDVSNAVEADSPLVYAAASATVPPTPTPSTAAPTVATAAADDKDDDKSSGAWEVASLVILGVNAVGIVGFSLFMRHKVSQEITRGNIIAITLGWIDQISDFLFGVELLLFTPEGGAIVRAIGAVALVWFALTALFNYVMWQRILKDEQKHPYDKAAVVKDAELYAALTIFMLGSLDLMTVWPWKDPNVRSRTRSYPSKPAMLSSIRSELLEDGPQLLFNIIYFAVVGGGALFPIVNFCVTILTLLWTIFTKMNILHAFDELDGPAAEAESIQTGDQQQQGGGG
jgi:hypothetical protein